jgi:hypothetical protein
VAEVIRVAAGRTSWWCHTLLALLLKLVDASQRFLQETDADFKSVHNLNDYGGFNRDKHITDAVDNSCIPLNYLK